MQPLVPFNLPSLYPPSFRRNNNVHIMTMHSPVSISTVRSLHEHVDCRHERRSQSIHWKSSYMYLSDIICEREMIMEAVPSFDGAS